MNEHHDKHDKDLMPESAGIVVKPIAWFLIILTIATAFVFVLVKGMLFALDRMEPARTPQLPSRVAEGAKLPQREPLLQGAPQADPNKPGAILASDYPLEDMAKYRSRIEKEVTGYGWVAGKENSEARIPIERAKQLLLEKGLPVKAETAITELQNAEKTRQQMNAADASGGRLIGKQ